MAKKRENKTAVSMTPFEGFPNGTFRFLRTLERNNNREWFAENREKYESFFLEPALAFINAMQPVLATTAPTLIADARKTGGSLMRIYRDTRFSKEKTPYKTNLGIQFRHQLGEDVHSPGIYLHVDTKQCFLGAGMWRPPSDELKRIRSCIEEYPVRWKRIVQRKGFQDSFELYDDRLKSVPRGYAKDHPMIEHLRLKSYIAMAHLSQEQIESPDLVATTKSLIKEAKALMQFLCESLGQPY